MPLPRGIYMYKIIKNVYKIRFFFKLATNGQNDKGFLLTSKVCPQGVVCPCPGAIYMYKIIKNVYIKHGKKSDVKEIFLNWQQMGKVIWNFC